MKHLLLELLKLLPILCFFLLFLPLCTFDIDLHIVAKIVCELKFLARDLLLLLLRFQMRLQIVQEQKALGELDMLVQGVREAETDLLQVEVSEC